MGQSTKNGNFKIINKDIENMINQYINASKELAELKAQVNMDTYYDAYTNTLWYKKNVVAKEIPLLSCLQEDKKGNNKCTYKYGQGFSYYTTDTQGGNG